MSYTEVTCVLVGFSKGLVSDLDRVLPPKSVLVIEEPDVIRARDVRRRLAAHACVAGLLEARIQDEHDLSGLDVPRPDGVRLVVPAIEYGVAAAAALAEAWGLPGAGSSAARVLRDKSLLRMAAEKAGIPQPAWSAVAGPADVDSFRAAHDRRCVLKPANRQGSLGVQLLDARVGSAEAWAETSAVAEPRMRPDRELPTTYLAEEWLTGPEVSVECLVADGTIVFENTTAKDVYPGRRPVELGHTVPAPITPEVRGCLSYLMRELVRSVGFGSGILHAEWILVDGAFPHLVECAGRIPGDGIDTLIDLSHGGSLVADLLRVLSGRSTAARRPPERAAAIRFLALAPGTVAGITGVDEARSLEGVHELEVTVETGSAVSAPRSSWDRVGYVITHGSDTDEAVERAERALALITVEIRTA